jgi:hypothetical protein
MVVSSISAAEAISDAAKAARVLRQEGALVVRQACPPAVADTCRQHVDAALQFALESSGEKSSAIEYIPWMERTYTPHEPYDFYTPYPKPRTRHRLS